ncbi:glycosyltransferase family A protein [Pedobacter agri]|uniref:glycosyltransferase family 2 protein n=1 Tax=Pedobacter agri TaxID=454586 RepID=UPI002931DB43|nr:glycosyltransferase family A protein [Pedobacter agri]
MSFALVSIIIPVYNAEKYLSETIESAMNQTWKNIEIIIVDDGSTDDSLRIARDFENSFIKVYHQPNKGASSARNYGFKISKGDYIQYLDADDLLSNDKIENQLNTLKNFEDHISITKTVYFKKKININDSSVNREWFNNNHNEPVDFLKRLYANDDIISKSGGMVTLHSWLTPRTVLTKAGDWNEGLTVDDDGEYFCRVILASQGIRYSENGINFYRKYDTDKSLSSTISLNAYQSVLNALKIKHCHLIQRENSQIIDTIFAEHLWRLGVSAYPQYKSLSLEARTLAKRLGLKQHKYYGGPVSKFLSRIFSWKLVRIINYKRYGI